MIFFFTALVLVNDFFFININDIGQLGGGASGLSVLILSFMLLIVLFLLKIFKSERIYIKKSFLVLLFFFFYVVFKIIVDTGNMARLKAMTIATSGGFLLFYAIGAMINFTFNRIIDMAKHKKYYFILLFLLYGLYLAIHSFYLLITLINFISRLSGLHLLISGIEGDYQRSANFLIISSLVLSSLYTHILLLGSGYGFFLKKIILVVYFFLYSINLILSMLLSQMIQSNNGLVCIGGILLVSLFLHVYLCFPKNRRILSAYYFKFRNIVLGKIGKKIILSGIITLVSFVMVLLFSISLIGIDINTLRITGYGEGEISSVKSRADINSKFFVHFFYSPGTPILGNMQVDTLTTGTGTNMHSFLLSVLTHLGMFGFGIIFIFLYLSCKELLQKDVPGVYANGIKIYKILLFLFFFIIANMAWSFSGISFWFLMGLIFLPLGIKKLLYQNRYSIGKWENQTKEVA
jgi:hypothetical protein